MAEGSQVPIGDVGKSLGGVPSATLGGLIPAFGNIDDRKLIELDMRLENFFVGYGRMMRSAMTNLSTGLLSIVRPLSPYWTGHLRRYHFAQVLPDGGSLELGGGGGGKTGDWLALVAVDPDAPPHPKLGGIPSEYGARLHNYQEPWFEYAMNSYEFKGVIDAVGAKIVGYYESRFFDPVPSFNIPAGVFTGGKWIDTEEVPWSEGGELFPD